MKNTIKILRAKHGLTQEQLAIMIGISRPALSDIENNKVMPSGRTVIRLANIFKIPVGQIFFEPTVNQEEQKSENNHPAW